MSDLRKEIGYILTADNVNTMKLSFHSQVQSMYDLMKAFSQIQLRTTAGSERAINK